jgi:hypothetical protein
MGFSKQKPWQLVIHGFRMDKANLIFTVHAISDHSRAWKFTGVDQGVHNPVKMEIFQNISAERGYCFQ